MRQAIKVVFILDHELIWKKLGTGILGVHKVGNKIVTFIFGKLSRGITNLGGVTLGRLTDILGRLILGNRNLGSDILNGDSTNFPMSNSKVREPRITTEINLYIGRPRKIKNLLIVMRFDNL